MTTQLIIGFLLIQALSQVIENTVPEERDNPQRAKFLKEVDFNISNTQSEIKEEMDGTVKTRPHERLQNGKSSSRDVLMFPRSSSGIKRHKREWVIPPINIPENQRGVFPKQVVQIKSSKSKEFIIHYSMTGPGADLPPTGLFKMDKTSGWLLVTEPLDREKQSEYLLTVHAVSIRGNIEEDPMEITVIVLDQNDNKPEFISNTFTGYLGEGSQPGTSVMTVTAIDKDDPTTDNGMFKFAIMSQTPRVPNPQMFTINQDTGTISVISAGLDREKVSEYTLILQVADLNGFGLTNTATASIILVDQNHNAPQFNPTTYSQNVPENAVDFEVVRLIVTDKDEPHTPAWNAKYRIVKGNDGGNFGIITDPDSNDGIVKTIKGLDFEANRQYILLITVENKMPFSTPLPTSTATLTVTVEDVNEAPIFNPPMLTVPVNEHLPVNSLVANYLATDPDIEKQQTVTYQMKCDPENLMRVNATDGSIFLNRKIRIFSPFIKGEKYTALITAADNGQPPMTSTGTIQLIISFSEQSQFCIR
ncbi:cadherin-4-like [Polypterus senegalus]|uniref:cadherin-4-like n=1 Tax=Polypterus senegalus TaxID=55291 RepID=UPI00196251E8|nr:cadherin-4-like [Polypterus senegalus]